MSHRHEYIDVIHVVWEFYPYKSGSIPELIGGLVAALAEERINQTVITPLWRNIRLPIAGETFAYTLEKRGNTSAREVLFHPKVVPGKVNGLLVEIQDMLGPQLDPSAEGLMWFLRAADSLILQTEHRNKVLIHLHGAHTSILRYFKKAADLYPPIVESCYELRPLSVVEEAFGRLAALGLVASTAQLPPQHFNTFHVNNDWSVNARYQLLSSVERNPVGGVPTEQNTLVLGVDRQRCNPGRLNTLAAPYGPRNFDRKVVSKQWLLRQCALNRALKPILIGVWLTESSNNEFFAAIHELEHRVVYFYKQSSRWIENIPLPENHALCDVSDTDNIERYLASVDLLIDLTSGNTVNMHAVLAMRLGTLILCFNTSTASKLLEQNAAQFYKSLVAPTSIRAWKKSLNALLSLYGRSSQWQQRCKTIMRKIPDWRMVSPEYREIYLRTLFGDNIDGYYDVSGETDGDSGVPYLDWGPRLKDKVGPTFIRLFIKNPHVVYCFWSIRQKNKEFQLELINQQTQEIVGKFQAGQRGTQWFQVDAETAYYASIKHGEKEILRSNMVYTPRYRPHQRLPKGIRYDWDEEIESSI